VAKPTFRIKRDRELIELGDRLPLLPLRDIVVFPHMVVPLLVGRTLSIRALDRAMAEGRFLFLITQRDPNVTFPKRDDLYTHGTISRIVQLLKLPDGTVKALVEGLHRAQIVELARSSGMLMARIEPIAHTFSMSKQLEALLRNIRSQFEVYIKLNRKIPDEVLLAVDHIDDPERLADIISAHLLMKPEDKQSLLACDTFSGQLGLLAKYLASEIDILKLEKDIEGAVRTQVSKDQRQFYLTEQLKAIRKELGYGEEENEEYIELAQAIDNAGMPSEVRDRAHKELNRLTRMPPMSPEATVIRNYLDWLIAMPWNVRTEDNLDMDRVQSMLDADHYGLENVKKRILEYLAVLKLTEAMRGQILCFVGGPGVGKTSLGRSIAHCLGRKFVRVSLGGVRDEAEIRGHRRTYIGALPGRVIQQIRRAASKNPVFLFDEIDKIGADFRGDPAAALLEVLDPEVNATFNDHYLEVDFDLSEVLFICTANVLHTIPPALQDRMEIIRLPGYLEHEKIEIVKRFLIPKEREANGLKDIPIRFTRAALLAIIRHYTREVGVRNLQREIASICRKIALRVANGERGERGPFVFKKNSLIDYLGAPRYLLREREYENRIGVATGLAWTEHGGDTLQVEVEAVSGRGRLILTGHLGDVMKESAEAALTYARSHARDFGLNPDFYRKIDIHVHVPEGAIPKDGPSAGITIATAIVSVLTKIPVRHDVAMTGEITLQGQVLGIGGLAEKMVAAQRSRICKALIPKANKKDLQELPKEATKGMDVVLVEQVKQVLQEALTEKISPRAISSEYDQNRRSYAHSPIQ
jgi:ATP-dependent Lon protease